MLQIRRFVAALLCLLCITASALAQSPVLLAQNKTALLPIVISAQASQDTKDVAADLKHYLDQISGANFAIQVGDGSKGIVLGTLAQFPDAALKKPLEVRDSYDGAEAYCIRTQPGRALLLGATDLGASHAAYALLESIGCRWFFPAKEWEVIPSKASLQVQLNKDDRPAILSRRIWYGYGLFDKTAREDYTNWTRRNLLARSLAVNVGESWEGIVRRNKAVFAAHPEYYALVKQADGTLKRQPPMLEMGNPALRQLIINDALETLRKNPALEMASIGPCDGIYKNQSPESKAYGATVSDQIFGMVNEVARAVHKEFPGKMVGVLAYSNYSDPPSFPLEPNVFIELTHGFNFGNLSFDELLQQWPTRVKRWGGYEYFDVFISDHDMLPGGAGANVAFIRKQLPRYAALGATSFSAESSNNWGPNGRGYYLASKLLWNPKADADALLQDFYEKAFGPAAAVMKRYYNRFNPSDVGGIRPTVTGHLIGLGFQDIQVASTLAKGRPDVEARLDDLKQYLRYVEMYWKLRREKNKMKGRAIQLEIFTHAYRTRYSYMEHWLPMQRGWSVKAAKEFVEPTWSMFSKAPKPWTGTPDYTQTETEAAFQEGLKYFAADIKTGIVDKKYSDDLVPVRFPGEAIESQQAFRLSTPCDFYSVTGGPLQMEVVSGWISTVSGLHEKTHFALSVLDSLGKPVGQEVFENDGKAHPISFKVPHAGLYHVTFNDAGLGFKLTVPATQPMNVVLGATRGVNSKVRVPLYFYVPKGTRQFDYTFNGAGHSVMDSEGKSVLQVSGRNEMVTVKVPPGQDGKVWSFSPYLSGTLQFTNLANQVSPSATILLLPREVALSDGLTIITK